MYIFPVYIIFYFIRSALHKNIIMQNLDNCLLDIYWGITQNSNATDFSYSNKTIQRDTLQHEATDEYKLVQD